MNGFLADCRHGFRLYVRTPVASLIAVLVLAVAMAFVVAFLSLYVDLVLRPHPGFEQSGRIATVAQNLGPQTAGPGVMGLPHELVERLAAEMTSIEAAVSVGGTGTLIGPDAEPAVAAMVSEGFFAGLRPRVLLGHGLGAADHAPDAEPAVVLSYDFWQQHFGGDPDVLGTFIEISRDPAVCIVARPEAFLLGLNQSRIRRSFESSA